MIGELLSKKYKNIDKNIRACFIVALMCGIFAHIYALTNHLYNYDELYHTPTGFGTGVQMGRWGLSVLAWVTRVIFKDVFTIPLVNGMVSIVMYAIVACIVVDLFDIKDGYFAAVIGALITTFPSVVCRMFYMYTTHYYAVAEAIVAISVLLLFKYRNKSFSVILSIILLMFGMAVYQANFATAVCITVGVLLIQFIKEEVDFKTGIRNSICCLLYLGLSMGLYFISNALALKATGLKMIEHSENYDTMGQMNVGLLIESILRCYKNFLKMPFKDVYATNPNIIVRITYLIAIIIMAYVVVKVWSSGKCISQKILFSLVALVIPVAVDIVEIMAASSGIMYSIMTFDIVFIFVLAIGMLEASCQIGCDDIEAGKISVLLNRMYKGSNVVFALALFGTIISYIWFANGNYLAMEYTNNHDNAYYQVLMTQIKSVAGYEEGMPVAIVGSPGSDTTNSRQDMLGGTFNIGGKASTNVSAYSSWNIMTRVLGFDPTLRNSDEEEQYFMTNEEVKEMPCYPADGSIKIVDDTIVIKFED